MSQFMRALANVSSSSLVPPGRVTASGNNTAVDLQLMEGSAYILSYWGAGGGTAPTMDLKLQHSDDNSTFTDVTGGAFSQVGGAASETEKIIDVSALKRYVRINRVVAGTSPTFDGACVIVWMKKQIG